LNSPLFTRQNGFVKNSNMTCALFDFIVRVQELLDANLKTGGLFLDLAKAFDIVNHQFLLVKLQTLSIRFGLARWFRSYLWDQFGNSLFLAME
jgi:hypothetical protein